MNQSRGTFIAERRKSSGMTQAELAEKMGVTDKAVSKWERDLSCPDIESLPRLAEVLQVPVQELLGGEGQTKLEGKNRELVPLICKAVALAMGTAVAVLSAINRLDSRSGFGMLGIGLAAAALVLLQQKNG